MARASKSTINAVASQKRNVARTTSAASIGAACRKVTDPPLAAF